MTRKIIVFNVQRRRESREEPQGSYVPVIPKTQGNSGSKFLIKFTLAM